MQVTQTASEGLAHSFKVVVPAKDVETRLNAKLVELSKKVSIPGFRPGKVPMSMMKQRYGQNVMGEVLEEAVNESSTEALQTHSVRPALQPKVEIVSFNEGSDLEFTISVEALPQVEPKGLSDIKLTRMVAPVDPAKIDEALARMAERSQTFVPSDSKRKLKKGDVVKIDFDGKVDGVRMDGMKGEDMQVELGKGQLIDTFEDQIAGHKVGDNFIVNVTFPENYHAKELAGKASEFDVTVKALGELKGAEIDEEFAKSLGFSDLESLKKNVGEMIGRDQTRVSRDRLKRDLLDVLAEKHDFTVPQGMVDLEFDAIWNGVQHAIDHKELAEEDKAKPVDDLKAEYRAIAERRVRLGLLLAEIGTKNNLTIDPAEVNRAIMAEAQRFPGYERQVFDYYRKNAQALAQLRAPLYEDKVVDYLLELAQVSDQNVTLEELLKQPNNAKPFYNPDHVHGPDCDHSHDHDHDHEGSEGHTH